MDNHYHLLITPSGNLPQIMRHINGAYTTYFNVKRDIFDEVESVLGKQPALAQNIKMFLSQKCTGEKRKDIGIHFGIGKSGVSQGNRRVADKIKKDKKLKRKLSRLKEN